MVNSKAGLALYLSFNSITSDQKVIDASSNGQNGTLYGNAQLVDDDTFSRCLKVDGEGDYVDTGAVFSGITDTFTIEAWVFPESEHQIDQESINGIVGTAGQKYIIWPTHGNAYGLGHAGAGISVGTNGVSVYEHADGYMPALLVWQGSITKWTHIAVVYNNKQPSLYVNGAFVKKGLISNKIVHPCAGKGNAYSGQSGGIGGGTHGYFKGKIAHVRIYSRALSAQEMQSNIQDDQVALATFRKAYPIGFSLHDDNDEAVLYISDASEGDNLRLEVVNTWQQDIQLIAPQKMTAASDNHHFELRFRPGTLSANTLSTEPSKRVVLVESGWNMSYQVNSDRTVSLYFLSTNARIIKPSEKISLKLQRVNAAADGGVRGTRVELRYRQLQYQGETISLTGSREQYLSIVNRQGKKNIPLHVGFVGSNTILNDGSSQNELKLRIANVLKAESLPLSTNSASPSKFIISFDVQAEGEPKEWALATKSQVQGITVKVSEGKIQQEIQGQSPEWIVTLPGKTALAAGKDIQFTLSNIISSLPSGHTNLYVRYENIPGYWDGQFVVPIEKAPILYRQSCVGIGTANPTAKLHIQGDAEGNVWEAIALRYNRYWANQGTAINFYHNLPKEPRIEAQIRTHLGGGGVTDMIFSTFDGGDDSAKFREIMRLQANGNVRIAGALTQSSSRELKENIVELSSAEAIATLEGLNPLKFNYKDTSQKETHIGFIAEDVPELVASPDRKHLSAMDIVAVLTKVVKEQQEAISVLQEKLKALEGKNQL